MCFQTADVKILVLADLCPCFHRSHSKLCPILCRLRTKLRPNFGRSRARLCPISFAPRPLPNLAGTLVSHLLQVGQGKCPPLVCRLYGWLPRVISRSRYHRDRKTTIAILLWQWDHYRDTVAVVWMHLALSLALSNHRRVCSIMFAVLSRCFTLQAARFLSIRSVTPHQPPIKIVTKHRHRYTFVGKRARAKSETGTSILH